MLLTILIINETQCHSCQRDICLELAALSSALRCGTSSETMMVLFAINKPRIVKTANKGTTKQYETCAWIRVIFAFEACRNPNLLLSISVKFGISLQDLRAFGYGFVYNLSIHGNKFAISLIQLCRLR